MRSEEYMKERNITKSQNVSGTKIERSRELRKNMTDAEFEFWEMVRDRKMFGLKFRRQQVIDGFIVDFYCDSAGLCIEIDGDIHNTEDQQSYDRLRDEILSLRNLKILRFSNEDVLNNKGGVKQRIMEAI